MQRHHRGIVSALFESADVLLTETLHLLPVQAALAPNPRGVVADLQPAKPLVQAIVVSGELIALLDQPSSRPAGIAPGHAFQHLRATRQHQRAGHQASSSPGSIPCCR